MLCFFESQGSPSRSLCSRKSPSVKLERAATASPDRIARCRQQAVPDIPAVDKPSLNKTTDTRSHRALSPSFGFSFEELYNRGALVRLDAVFLTQLLEAAPELHAQLLAARENPSALAPKPGSELIIALAPYLEDFIGRLFGIEKALHDLQAKHNELAPLYSVKRKFIQKKALTGYTAEKASLIDGYAIAAELEAFTLEPLTERSFADHVARWMENESEHVEALRLAAL